MEYAGMLLLGLILLVIGSANRKGNISTIHWYQRQNVTEEGRRPYGRLMGTGTALIGGCLIVTGILQMIAEREGWNYIILAGTVIGLGLMLYAQFKYNRGLF